MMVNVQRRSYLAAVAALLLVISGYSLRADVPPREAGKSLYIVVLYMPGEMQRNGHGAAPHQSTEPDVAALGGVVHQQWSNRRVVSLPDAAVEQLRKLPSVKYMQKVYDGTPPRSEGKGALTVVPTSFVRLPDSGLASWDSGTFRYDGAGNIKAIGSNQYVYDTANRLVSSTTGGVAETYKYDSFGNRIESTRANVTSVVQIDPTTNRAVQQIGNLAYDESGDAITFAGRAYRWDSFHMAKSYGPAQVAIQTEFVYTADDERIGSLDGLQGWNWTVRDFEGHPLREYNSPGASVNTNESPWLWVEDHVWRDGQLLAGEREPREGGRRHFHLDHLGTPRLITDNSSAALKIAAHDYYPFGVEQTDFHQEMDIAGFDRPEPLNFTGHQRDFTGGIGYDNIENYVDYMHARYYSPTMGRFLSVDPFMDTAVAVKNPQGWNRYAYVRNSPINKTDPAGKCEDPKPDSGGTRICIQAFIPTKTFTGFIGDNRNAKSNGGTFRTNQSIMFSSNGKATAPPLQPGVSAIAGAPKISRTAVVADQGLLTVAPGVVEARGAASDGLGFGLAPNLSYSFTIAVDKSGKAAVLGGKHSGYPAFEVWSYRDGKAPDLLYTYNPSRNDALDGFLNISLVTVDVESQAPALASNVP